ncbi:virulence-related protein [Clostridium guangxiense]|uniref:virulence-related protein n=1 Tax=Clostridium guangxiense TaxID=1662055 RepID=UPI001E2CC064|nr:virulence-related protein [Clostridium guangxiense]MCD2347412.1 virulence-related protein [Clostridium guangxiense]
MDRKEIVKVLSEHFGVKAEYMGVPSFAYQIETEGETYTIDKVGKITNAKGSELELEAILKPAVKIQEQEEKNVIEENAETEPQIISVPILGHTGISLKNLVNMIYSKHELIQKSLGIEENIVAEDFIKELNEAKISNTDDFQKAIAGKQSCIQIEFNFEEQKISFNFIKAKVENITAYTQFIELLNQSAKKLKHASAKVSSTDNPKFTFRVFLIRLGMIGDEYKTARKILLEKLEGNAAFRYGKPEKKIEDPTGEQ